ncbi:MAG: hypothetical protein COU29_00445 [Candidatus Magasanikbacteria bacterium CG10_big_fil_rev_8_21_14_0_10_36_32]|uniref:histidine kinase n=1 Tax=Candidatus Magasanikbacteria bacterium CG10_big_fil_rev_8_21_14_0_10_36_32 TaxID=1974646 RepID=A0A2M6W7F0_9BACT|nr:MAG: hypothetical protein COU29_00445 [Candidatus Magasanikbacteria bacterium CG10_big_fil_rev_8_21_14_0_10_36_32]
MMVIDEKQKLKLIKFYQSISHWLGIVVLTIGGVVLVGWIFDIQILKSVLPGLVAMKANTAVCFVLSGFTLILLQEKRIGTVQRIIGGIFSFLVLLLGVLTLTEYIFGFNFYIDQLLFKELPDAVLTFSPGRMAANTAFNFFLIGVALLTVSLSRKSKIIFANILVVIVGIVSLLALIGYIFGVSVFYQGIALYTAMALHTAIAFLFIAISIFFIRFDHDSVPVLGAGGTGGAVVRRLLPVIVIVPIVLGLLFRLGEQRGYYNNDFELSFLTTFIIVILMIFFWFNAKNINKNEILQAESILKLEESEKKYREIFNNIQDIFFEVNMNGIVVDISPSIEQITKYKRDDLIGRDIGQLYAKKEERNDILKTLAKIGKVYDVEADFIDKDGAKLTGSMVARLIKNEKGVPLRIVGTIRDVTARRRAEDELKFKNIILDTQQNTSLDGILIVDEEGKIISFNRRFVKMWNITDQVLESKSDELALQSVLDKLVNPEEFLSRVKFLYEHKNEKSREEISLKDGRIFDRYSSPMLSLEKEYLGRVWYFSDVTENRQASSILKKSEEKYAALVENSNDGVLILQDEVIKFANRAMLNMFGLTEERVIGRSFLDFTDEPSKKIAADKYKKRMKGEKIASRTELNLIHSSGRTFSAEINAALIYHEGRPADMATVRDISKAKEIDRMKSEFVAVTSHQLRTPLTGIKWFTELLIKDKKHKLSKEQKDFIQQISVSNERLIRLVDDLLDVSHIETGRKYNVVLKSESLHDVIQEVVDSQNLSAKKKDVKIICPRCREKLIMPIDREKIRQVFSNLVSNAIKYSPAKSVIEIGREKKHEEIIIFIKDHGVGIPKHQQKRVFEKFFRADNVSTTETGTGLGLYIAKAIVEGHGGRIWFESIEKKGTTFYVALPIKNKLI